MPEKEFKNVKCWKPRQPRPDEFYRPLLMSIEMSRPKKSCCCGKPPMLNSVQYPCPQCNGNTGPFARHPAFQNNLTCHGNTACGSCSTGNALTCSDRGPCGNSGGYFGGSCGGGNGGGFGGGCSGSSGGCGGGGNGNGGGCGCRCARLPGQGPCDPPCFSTMIFPKYAPFVPEPRCLPHPLTSSIIADGCALAPVGGTSQYGGWMRSCYSCNNCGVPGKVDVCALPCVGCNNAACNPGGGCGGGCGG